MTQPALMQIDQAGLPTGTVGQARTDGLATGAVVTLTSTGSGGTTKFQLLWVPFGDTTARPSLAVTGNPKVWTFTPTTGVHGTYRIRVIEDEGLPTQQVETRTFGVRLPLSGILIPALNEVCSPDASLENDGALIVTDSENNAIDYPVSTYNNWPYAGWWRSQQELYGTIEALYATVQELQETVTQMQDLLTTSHQDLLASTLVDDTVDFNDGLDAVLTLDETIAELTLVMPTLAASRATAVRLFIKQGASGPFTVDAFAGDFVFLDDTPPTFSADEGTSIVLAGVINATEAVLRIIPTSGATGFPPI